MAALLLTTRQAVGVVVARLVVEADGGSTVGAPRPPTGGADHLAGGQRDVVEDGHVGEQVEALEHDADVLAQPVQVDAAPRRLLAVDPDGAPVDVLQGVDAAQQRRLPAARRADEAYDLVLVDLQVDALQTWSAEALVDAVDLEEGTAQPPALARACRATSQSVKRASGIVITTNATPAARLGDRLNRRFDVNGPG